MKLLKLNSDKWANVNLSKYKLDWAAKVSSFQRKVQDFLQPFWQNDEMVAELPIPGSKLRIDLVNISRKIAVEVSPRQHYNFNEFFNGNRINFVNSLNRDEAKRNWIQKMGWKLVELSEDDIKNLKIEMFDEIPNN